MKLILLAFLISMNGRASCLDSFKKLFNRNTVETVDDEVDTSRRNFLRGGAAALAIAATPAGVTRLASAAVADTVNRTELLRRAAKMRNGASISGMGDYAGALEKAASQADYHGVGEILMRRSQQLAERLSHGSDLFKKLPERIIFEGQRPGISEISNSPHRLLRIQRKLRASRIKTMTEVKGQVEELRDELMETLMESQNLQLQAMMDFQFDLSMIYHEMDKVLLSNWKTALENAQSDYGRFHDLYPELDQVLSNHIDEAENLLRILDEPIEEEAEEILE